MATLKVKCACGAKLRVPASAAGQRGRCPECKQVLNIPELSPAQRAALERAQQAAAASAAAAPQASSAPPEPEPESVFDQLAQDAEAALAKQTTAGPRIRNCPKCQQPMTLDAVLCVACGNDIRTGKRTRAKATAAKAERAAKVQAMAAGAKSFAKGCALSGCGALIGAIAWCAVAVATDYEIGWIAWGIGVLAGFGIVWGYGAETFGAGVTAALISLGGIFLGKCLVFVYVVYPQFQEFDRMLMEATTSQGTRLERQKFDYAERLTKRDALTTGLWSGDPKRGDIFERHMDAAEQMSAEELESAIAENRDWEDSGKWDNPRFARGALIAMRLDDAVEEWHDTHNNDDDADWVELEDIEVARMQLDITSEVDRMSPAEKDAAARELDGVHTRREWFGAVARHRAMLTVLERGVYYADPQYEKIYEAAEAEAEALDDDTLRSAHEDLEYWEEERFDDPSYVRNNLIDAYTNETFNEDVDLSGDMTDEQIIEEWNEHRAEAIARVDAIAPQELADTLDNLEQTQKREGMEMFRSAVLVSSGKEAFSIFMQEAFGIFDLLFGLLAVGSAYQIGTGGKDES